MAAKEKTKKTESSESYAIIRVRGETGINKQIKDTLSMLNLRTKFSCTIVPKTKVYDGMIAKAKDFITWGEIDSETEKILSEKRKKQGEKSVYRLSPPRGGFERKGVKKTYPEGGVLGYRKEKINDLLKRMM